jgi:fatty-acyl-CoA synthase
LERFGIEHVVEHYGASEMPGSALTNWTGQSGYCGFIPPDHPDATDILLVDEQGKPVAKNKPGQALFRVSSGKYRGYLDSKMDEDRLWKNLLEADDLWWKSGDLLTLNTEGFYKFVDRIGDSFRWKGENVATLEVEEALLDLEQVSEAVVYGISISGHSGKVGMASILPKEPMDPSHLMSAVMSQLIHQLPRYAIPHFIRLTTVPHETTSTLKTRKAQLIEDGFQKIDHCPHYVLSQGKYIFLTHDHLEKIGSENFTLGF